MFTNIFIGIFQNKSFYSVAKVKKTWHSKIYLKEKRIPFFYTFDIKNFDSQFVNLIW